MRLVSVILAAALLWATCGGDNQPDPDEPTGVECTWDDGDWDQCDWQ